MAVQAVPEGHHAVTPQLSIEGAAKAIDFDKQAEEMKKGAGG